MQPVSALAARVLPAAAGAPTGVTPGQLRVRVAEEGGLGSSGATGPAFGDTLRMAIERADGAQKNADAQVEAFVAGEADNVHDAMIAMNEASLHFQLLTEVRNKLLDGYQELMRMQV